MEEVHKCKKCGDPTPPGKDLCWCCEHAPKLHPMEPKKVGGKDNG